jgi:hypothetical protein
VPLRQESVRDAALVKDLDRPGVQAQPTGTRDLVPRASLDDRDIDTREGELGRQHQARRASAHDHDRMVVSGHVTPGCVVQPILLRAGQLVRPASVPHEGGLAASPPAGGKLGVKGCGSVQNRPVEPRVGIAAIPIESADGSFTIGRDDFPDFARYERLGVHVQSDQVRIASPDRVYVQAALTALTEACRELGVPQAEIAFVDTVIPPPTVGLRYGFKGAYTTDRPTVIWIFANWTSIDELRIVVRHEAAHLAFARTHSAAESAGHTGPSEDFALAFERG